MGKRGTLAAIGRLIKNLWRDLRHGGRFLGGSQPSRFSHLGANETANTGYEALEVLFDRAGPRPGDVIVDVGCGRGRVMNYLLERGWTGPAIGLELDPDIAAETGRRLAGYANIRVLAGDMRQTLPAQGTVFYLYNPFQAPVMAQFSELVKPLAAGDRPLLIYYNCQHLEVFGDDPFWRVEPLEHPAFIHQAALIRPAKS